MDLEYTKLSTSGSFTSTVTLIQDVISMKYEGEEPLPQVMNLMEADDDNKIALHLAIENNLFVTLIKLLNSEHVALGLALIKTDSKCHYTPLETLLVNPRAYDSDLQIIKSMLDTMESKIFPSQFFNILEKIRTNHVHMENERLMNLIFPYYQKVSAKRAATSYIPAFQSQDTPPRRDFGYSTTSREVSSLSAPTFFKHDHKQ
jgi:hypothetical protein